VPNIDPPEPRNLPTPPKLPAAITPTVSGPPPVRPFRPSEATIALFGAPKSPSIWNADGSLNGEAVSPLMWQLSSIKGRLKPAEAAIITQAQDTIRNLIGHPR